MQTNLQQHLPKFSNINIETIEAELDHILNGNRNKIDILLKQEIFEWDNFLRPLQELDERLSSFWSPISHLNAVNNTDEMRSAYNACLPKLTAYFTELLQNESLYNAFKQIHDHPDFVLLSQAQQQMIKHALRDFHLAGVDLEPKKKKQFAELQQQLAQLTTKFEENVLDATQHWFYHTTDEKKLAGIPAATINLAKQLAEQRQLDGYVLTLDFPIYYAVITYADDRELRQTIYTAYTTRASDQGPDAGKYDNSSAMCDILKCRQQLAHLLKFKTYADYSLATKMADSTKTVISFIEDLANKSHHLAEQELKELQQFANDNYQVQLEAWDMAYYSEKLKQQQFNLDQEQLRQYFPEQKVMTGLFEIAEKLYGIRFKEITDFDSWHKDAKCFAVYDYSNSVIAFLYTDLYARDKKRGGAWMSECRNRYRRADGSIQLAAAFLNCNFSQPTKEHPSLLNHIEVVTVFHEFGHCLQHILTTIDVAAVSGINGVEWDAVELASQIHENWCWQEEAIKLISSHIDSKEPLPETMLQQLLAAKNFQSGMQMLRQLEFSLFDFKLHLDCNEQTPASIEQCLNQVRQQIAVITPPPFNRFQHGFSHIFGGGYAAGYYSYKWAEVLSSDAFSLFEEQGIFDKATGEKFLTCILQPGSSEDALDLFIKFRGRKPNTDALLRHSGIE